MQEAREMTRYKISILGVSENRWTGKTGNGRLTLADGTTVLCSGRKDGQHPSDGALMLDKSAAKTLIEWRP